MGLGAGLAFGALALVGGAALLYRKGKEGGGNETGKKFVVGEMGGGVGPGAAAADGDETGQAFVIEDEEEGHPQVPEEGGLAREGVPPNAVASAEARVADAVAAPSGGDGDNTKADEGSTPETGAEDAVAPAKGGDGSNEEESAFVVVTLEQADAAEGAATAETRAEDAVVAARGGDGIEEESPFVSAPPGVQADAAAPDCDGQVEVDAAAM